MKRPVDVLTFHTMALSPGDTLHEFEIVHSLGAGGMGEVYRARDTKLDREVAVKVLPEELSTDRERRARFEREAELLAALNHPATTAGGDNACSFAISILDALSET